MDKDIKKIGELGEAQALEYLKENGWHVAKYGKEMHAKRVKDLNIVHDNCLNIPFGPEKNLFKIADEEKVVSDYIKNPESIAPSFTKANIIADRYIKNYYSKWLEDNPLPNDVAIGGKRISNAEKEENRQWMDKFPGKDHPGRYDFVGLYDNKYSAIEVKVNTSRLGYWQKMRLGILSKLGIDVRLVRINSAGYESLEGGVNLEKITPDYFIETPADDEIVEIISYRPVHIRMQELKVKHGLSSLDILEYAKAGLTPKDIIEKYESI